MKYKQDFYLKLIESVKNTETNLGGGGENAPQGKLAIFATFLHFRQQKTYQGTLGTQRWTLIGSRTSHGPSMDPTGPLKWTSKLLSHFQAWFAISTSYTHCNHSNHVGTLFWSLDLQGPLNGAQKGP